VVDSTACANDCRLYIVRVDISLHVLKKEEKPTTHSK
jgi:hypothetical protein